MSNFNRSRNIPAIVAAAAVLLAPTQSAQGAGVTLVTHGFNGNVTEWIIPMTARMADYDLFPGTAFSCYQITVNADSSRNSSVTQSRIGGVNPINSDSGEILIKLDWSSLSANLSYSSSDIAGSVVPMLLAANFVAELGGRPLAEFPIHLVGHSRGGSVISEMARFLGQQGVWVDHQTTLDPVPVAAFGAADVHAFINVLFADNYWQMNSDFLCPDGKSLAGAYNRFLANLSNGYSCNHSDVHLWYHGTIDWTHTPATDAGTTGSGATITSTERTNWWTGYESQGHFAGFYYSLIGGGNRLSADEPAGAGTGRIRDGYNQIWDFGAGTSANRQDLPSNNGSWPNLIKLDILTAQPVVQGEALSLAYFFQFNQPTTQNATIQIYLDNDANPYNGNQGQIFQSLEPGAGTNVVLRQFSVNTSGTPPGNYYVYAQITSGTHTRYLHAPMRLIIRSPVTLEIARLGEQVTLTWPTNAIGFTLESTADFLVPDSWASVFQSPVVINGRNTVTNAIGSGSQYYRLRK